LAVQINTYYNILYFLCLWAVRITVRVYNTTTILRLFSVSHVINIIDLENENVINETESFGTFNDIILPSKSNENIKSLNFDKLYQFYIILTKW